MLTQRRQQIHLGHTPLMSQEPWQLSLEEPKVRRWVNKACSWAHDKAGLYLGGQRRYWGQCSPQLQAKMQNLCDASKSDRRDSEADRKERWAGLSLRCQQSVCLAPHTGVFQRPGGKRGPSRAWLTQSTSPSLSPCCVSTWKSSGFQINMRQFL